MKKILSVALVLCMMVSLCSVFALMPVSAAADDEITPGCEWSVTGKSLSATGKIAGTANGNTGENAYFCDDGTDVSEEQRRTKEEKIADLVSVWDKGIGDIDSGYDKDGKPVSTQKESVVFAAKAPDVLLTGQSGAGTYWGGFWCEALKASVPTSKWPITFDVDFGGTITTSGVRLGEGENDNGLIKKFKVYVQFPDADEDEWTYICTDGNTGTTKCDIDTPFGQNLEIKKLRIVVLESNISNEKLEEFKNYNGSSAKGGEYAYFQLSKIAMLKPYNDGGAEYEGWVPSTASSADQLDEYSVNDMGTITGARVNDDSGAGSTARGFDGDRRTAQNPNSYIYVNWDDEIEVSGIRLYPMHDCNATSALNGQPNDSYALKKFNNGMGYLTDKFTYSTSKTAQADVSASESALTTVLNANSAVPYPKAGGDTDYTKPVVISFGTNVKIKGYMLSGWTGVYNGEERGGSCGFGEVRLLKPKVVISNPDMEVHNTVANDVKFVCDISDSITASLTDVLDSEGTSIGTGNFEYDSANTSFVIKENYVSSLEEGTHKFIAEFSNGNENEITINKHDVTTVDYVLNSNTGSRRGTTDLVLNTVGGKEIKSIKYGTDISKYVIDIGKDKTETGTADADQSNLPFTYQYDKATVKISEFRKNLDLFLACEEEGKVYVDVTFTDGNSQRYTVNLRNDAYTVGGTINASEFRSDEVVAENTWSLKVDTQDGSNACETILNPWSGSLSAAGDQAPYARWHTGHTGTVPDSKTCIHWAEVDFGRDIDVSGLRYEKRGDGQSPWYGVTVWGKKDGTGSGWVALTDGKVTLSDEKNPTLFIKNSATVARWCEDVRWDPGEYRYIRIKINTGFHACANGLRFIKSDLAMTDSSKSLDMTCIADVTYRLSVPDSMADYTVKELTETGKNVKLETGVDYVWDSSAKTITLKNTYIESLGGKGTYSFELEMGDADTEKTLTFTLKLTDLRQIDYYLTYAQNGRHHGTWDLKIPAVSGKKIKEVAIHEDSYEWVHEDVVAGKKLYTLKTFDPAVDEAELTYNEDANKNNQSDEFKRSIDVFDIMKNGGGKVYLLVTFADDTTEKYTVNLKNESWNFSSLNINASYFRYDEVVPSSDWTAEFSSVENSNPQAVFIDQGASDPDHMWHSAYRSKNGTIIPITKSGAQWTEVDFKENTDVAGVRYTARGKVYEDGSTSNFRAGAWSAVEIWGKKDGDNQEWVKLKDKTSVTFPNAKTLTANDFEFTPGSYRYIRIKLYTPNSGKANDTGYGCTKYIKFLKPWVKVDGEDTVTVPSENAWAFDQTFNFKLVDGATGITKVTNGSAALASDTDYTVGLNCALTLKASCLSKLAENGTSTLTVEFNNGNTVEIKVTRKSILSADYKITSFKSNGEKNSTEDLYLTAPAGLQATKVVVDGTSIPYEQSGSAITIACQNLRTNMDLYAHYKEGTDAIVNVTFSVDGVDKVAGYKLNLSNQKLSFNDYNITADEKDFESDEIVPGKGNYGNWSVETDSAQNDGIVRSMSGVMPGAHTWHTGYTVVGGTNAITYKSGVRYYFDIDLGEPIAFSGIRYYRRVDTSSSTNTSTGVKTYWYNTSGLMKNMEIWGKMNESDEWVLLDPADYSFSWEGFTSWTDGQEPANATAYNDAVMDTTYKVRYIRLRPISQEGTNLSAASIRLLKGAYVEPAVTNSPVAMDFDLGEDALVKFNPASGLRLTGITCGGEAVPAEYITLTDDSVRISPYYFEDNNKTSGSVNFKAQFALGQEIAFAVKVGEVEGYAMSYTAGANGGVKAYASNEATGDSGVEKASGSKVRNSDKLIFTATPDTGYMVDEWSVKSATPVYERIADSEKKEWTISTNCQRSSEPITRVIDGMTDNFWHSDYGTAYGEEVTSPFTGEIWIKLMFDKAITNVNKLELTPRVDQNGTHITNYTLYALPADKDDEDGNWVQVTSGKLNGYKNENEAIGFEAITVKGLKLVLPAIGSGRDSHVYIGELYVESEKLPSGKVVRTGTGSEDFEIDDRFTDMAVNVTFKPVPAGTAAVSTDFTYATSNAPSSVAHGQDLVFTVTANTGYHAPESVTVLKDGEELVLGKDFTYTAVSDTAATVTVKNVSGSSIVVKGTAKDYKNHVVTYQDTIGATGQLPAVVQVIEGHDYVLESSNLCLEGYTFAGWAYYTTGAGGETVQNIYQPGETFKMPAQDVTFTAVWEKNSSGGSGSGGSTKPSGVNSKPSGNSTGSGGGIGGGTGGIHGVTVNGTNTKLTHGSVVPDPAPREGYVFNGYYLDEALTVPYANTGVTGDVTLYPSWTKERSRNDLTDIKGHWAEQIIGDLYEKEVVNGSDNKYNPDDYITRAEFIQILYNLSGMVSDGSHSFKDVATGDWFSLAVAWAVNFGITTGTADGVFSPYEKITREQMATMIYRYATLMGADWQTSENGEFSDGGSIADYAKYQVRWAKGNGIITGRPDGSFGPKDNATRAETAAMISRLAK